MPTTSEIYLHSEKGDLLTFELSIGGYRVSGDKGANRIGLRRLFETGDAYHNTDKYLIKESKEEIIEKFRAALDEMAPRI